jgi:membrane-associated phospholipid phosphatase
LKRLFGKRWGTPENKRREELLLLLLAVACLGLAWFFGKLGSEVLEGELLALDRVTQHWVVQHRFAAATAFFQVVTHLGAKEFLAPLGALIGWRLFRGTAASIGLLAFAALAAGEFVAVLKRNFHITRPAGGVAAGMGYSFPSGHTTGATAIAILLSYVALRQRRHARVVVLACMLGVVLVGASRIYLDVHWASDVIGGWLVGSAFGLGCCALYEIIHRRALHSTVLPADADGVRSGGTNAGS